MIRKLGLLTALLFCATSFAKPVLVAQEVQLHPGKTLVITNTLGIQAKVLCEVHLVENKTHSIAITALRGSGSINGTSISAGQRMIQALHHLQTLSIVANKNAQAEFTNISDMVIIAYCSLSKS